VAKTRVIGLDIGTTHVRAAELEFAGPRSSTVPTLVRCHETPLPPGSVRDAEVADIAAVSTALRRLWSEAKFGSKDCIIGVGNQRVVVRELDMPWMPLPQVRASLPFQVQDLLPMAVDEALLDYLPTGETTTPEGRFYRGLLVAASRDTVNNNVLATEGAGLRPQMVDLNAFALQRSIARGDLAERTIALVDIGARVTNVIVASHGSPRLVRTVPAGGQDATDAVARALGVAGPEAERIKREVGMGYSDTGQQAAVEAVNGTMRPLVEAVRNTFVYFAGNHPGEAIEMAVLTGGGAHLAGLGQYLASASRVPVVLGDPLNGVKVARGSGRENLAGRESMLAMSVGLAYGAAA
jgi:type IV pilus assembly protein PilM